MRLFDRLAAPFSPRARMRTGLDLIARGRGAKGFRHLARAARRGCAPAQYHVGRCYLEGRQVPNSPIEAMRWFDRAARAGDAEAQFLLAALYAQGRGCAADIMDTTVSLFSHAEAGTPDYAAALPWAHRAAEQGHAQAQALLGHILTAGPATLRDLDRAEDCFHRASGGGCPQGSLGLGLALLRRGHDDSTLRAAAGEIRKAAASGLGTAIYLLGAMTEFGVGIARDPAAAAALYRTAAEHGVRQGQLRWGLALLRGSGVARDAASGESWLRRAAQAGDVEAAALVGALCAKGGELPPNYVEAAIWLQRAAEQGHGGAARMLGQLYYTGAAGVADAQTATHWFQRAARLGDNPTQVILGNFVLAGEAAPETLDVRGWFEQPADAGDLVAAFNFAICLAEGVGVERDEHRAAQWLRRAAEGVPMAQYWYGRILVEGRGVASDVAQARVWLARAADAGIADAQVMLGELVLNGRGGPSDRSAARERFAQAAAQGNAGAMFALGALAGHDGDRAAAQSWFRQAAERGHAYAQLMLGRYLAHGFAGASDAAQARRWLTAAHSAGVTEAGLELERLRRAEATSRLPASAA